MLSGNEESEMKLSVISPNTRHKRGSVVPLTIAITDPIKMSNLSQPSAKRNYTRKHQRQRCSSQRPRVTDGAVSKRPRKVGVWKSEQINRVGRGKLSICCIGLVLKNFKWFIKKKNTWGSNGPLCSDSRGPAESVQTTGGSAALPSSLPAKPPYLIHKPVSHTHRKHTHTHTHPSCCFPAKITLVSLFSRLWKISKALKTNKQQYSISLLILNTRTMSQYEHVLMQHAETMSSV